MARACCTDGWRQLYLLLRPFACAYNKELQWTLCLYIDYDGK